MSRKKGCLFATIALVGALAVTSAAIANPVTPSSGTFNGLTSKSGETSLRVSKAGGASKIELKTMAIKFSCNFPEYPGGPIVSGDPIVSAISSTSFKANEKGLPLVVKNGKFSYKGPAFYGNGPGQPMVNFSGSFKSPTTIVGKLSLTEFSAEPVAGLTGTCDAVTVTFNAKHS